MKPWTLTQVPLKAWYRRSLAAYQMAGQVGVPADATWVQIEGIIPGEQAVIVLGRYYTMADMLTGLVWTSDPRPAKPVENVCGVKS